MLNFKESHRYQAIKQRDSIEDSFDEPTTSNTNSKYINTLRKLFINSLFIQGYLASIIGDNKSRNNDYDPIYGVICEYFGIKSRLNAVMIQDNDIVSLLYENNIDDTENKVENSPNTPATYILNPNKKLLAPMLLAIDNANIQIINTILDNDKTVFGPFTRNISDNHSMPRNHRYNHRYNPSPYNYYPTDSPMSYCISKLFEYQHDEQQTIKYMKVTKHLLTRNISPNALSQTYKASLLHYGCMKHDFEFVKSLVNQYQISLEFTTKVDSNQKFPMQYLNEYDDEDELKKFLHEKVSAYQEEIRRRRRDEDIPMDSGAGIFFYTSCTLCCFLPWTLVAMVNAGFYLYQWGNIHWSLIVLSIIIMILGVSLIFVTICCFVNRFYKSPDWAGKMQVITMILQQLFGVVFLIVQLVLNEYTKVTLALGITSVCLMLCFDCVPFYFFVRNKIF